MRLQVLKAQQVIELVSNPISASAMQDARLQQAVNLQPLGFCGSSSGVTLDANATGRLICRRKLKAWQPACKRLPRSIQRLHHKSSRRHTKDWLAWRHSMLLA